MLLVALVKGILGAVTQLQPYWLNCWSSRRSNGWWEMAPASLELSENPNSHPRLGWRAVSIAIEGSAAKAACTLWHPCGDCNTASKNQPSR